MKMYLFAWLSCFAMPAFSQTGKSDNPDDLRAKLYELKVKTVPPVDFKLPFQSIKIVDSRPDTSKLGFKEGMFLAPYSFQKILLKGGIANGIEDFYNDYYKNNFSKNGSVLLISLKKLWINNKPGKPVKSGKQEADRLSLMDIYAKFEYYFGTENTYIPLLRKDTLFQLTALTKVEEFNADDENKLPFLCFTLEKMIENVSYGDYLQGLENKKKMSQEDIYAYNAKSNKIPILSEAPQKGVFMTFDEFKNNRPSILSFSKRKIPKKKIEEVVDEKGNVILHYFAYYDGGNLTMYKPLSSFFAVSRSQYNPVIYKVGNSLQFFENQMVNSLSKSTVNAGNTSVPVSTPQRTIFRVPRQIDLETGDIY